MRSSSFCFSWRVVALTLLVGVASLQATVLTYPLGYAQDDDNPDFPAGTAGASVSSTYGDNVTQADIDAGYYGAEGGPTPDVLVWNDYENIYVKVSDDGFGDLASVLCSPYGWYLIELKTDTNHVIELHGFDMAARTDEGATIEVDIQIDGQTVEVLEPFIYGRAGVNGVEHVHFDGSNADGASGVHGFGTIVGRHIGIVVCPGTFGEDVGISNITFSQREDFQAYAAEPGSEATDVSLATSSLAWASHEDVVYDVWFGTRADFADVTPVRTVETTLDLAETALPFVSLDPDATYFWRVDTVQTDGTVTTGAVWSFTTVAGQAEAPTPLSESINQSGLEGQLSWTGPDGWEYVEACYHVYLGTEAESLVQISPSEGLSECVWPLTEALEASTTYFWRVDAVVHGVTYPGVVWSFDTAPLKATWPLPADKGAALASSHLRWGRGRYRRVTSSLLGNQ